MMRAPRALDRNSGFSRAPPNLPVTPRLLPLLALLAACGDSESENVSTSNLPPIQRRHVLTSLVTGDLPMTVAEENSASPVARAIVVPMGRSGFDSGTLPALRMPPPAEVTFQLPKGEEPISLDVALGAHRTAYERSHPTATVRYEVELNGQSLLSEDRGIGGQIDRKEQAWSRSKLDVTQGGELVLRTSIVEGDSDDMPAIPVGFGLMEITRTKQIVRQEADPTKPNVLLIVIDTLRADGLHCYGCEEEVSPTIDALAARGELYEQAQAPSSWTWPSTASLMTGLRPEEHAFTDPDSCYLDGDFDTLAEAFLEAGFSTGGFISNPLLAAGRNLEQGFEYYETYQWQPGRMYEDKIFAWLDENDESRFFLYVHMIEPHSPEDPDPDLLERFVADKSILKKVGRHQIRQAVDGFNMELEYTEAVIDRHKRSVEAYYLAEMLTADRSVGRMLANLESRGLLDNTIIAITSDHGESFFEHGQFGHGTQLHSESVHVPLILAGPGIQQRRISAPVENRFVGRRLLEAAGVQVPKGNLTSGALDEELSRRFFSTYTGIWFADEKRIHGTLYRVVDGDLSFHWAKEGAEGEVGFIALYDLASDPGETTDLSAERPTDVARLQAVLEAYLADSEAKRPAMLEQSSEDNREMLKAHGYLGGDEDD